MENVWTAQEEGISENIYFNQVGKFALLGAQEEQALARRWKNGDELARQQMINHNLRLVIAIAKRYKGRGLSLLDLIEEGNLGLMRAVDKFDPELGYRFSSYASHWVAQSIERALMNQSRVVRLPVHIAKALNRCLRIKKTLHGERPSLKLSEIARQLGESESKVTELFSYQRTMTSFDVPVGFDSPQTLADTLPCEHQRSPQWHLEAAETEQILYHSLAAIPQELCEVLNRRFGLNGHEPQTLKAIGHALGYNSERVCQLQKRALKALQIEIAKQSAYHPPESFV